MKFSKEHEWMRVEGDLVVIGITEFASKQLGDVVFVDVPQPRHINKDMSLSTLESVKAASDVYAPVEGEIVEGNEELAKRPEIINEDPLGAGWICKMKVADLSVLDAFMNAEEYANYIG